jgi:hypothetical protein
MVRESGLRRPFFLRSSENGSSPRVALWTLKRVLRRIFAFRNRLIHGYDLLDDALVWETVKTEVPALLSEVADCCKSGKNKILKPEKQTGEGESCGDEKTADQMKC